MPYEELVIPSIYPICCDATGTQPRQQPLPTDYTTAPSNNGIKSTKTVTNVLAPMHFASCGLIGIGTLPRIEALLSKTIPTRKENRDSSPKTDNIFFACRWSNSWHRVERRASRTVSCRGGPLFSSSSISCSHGGFNQTSDKR